MDNLKEDSPVVPTSPASTMATIPTVDVDSTLSQSPKVALTSGETTDQSDVNQKQSPNVRTNFMPHQMLMQTALTVEYGKDPTITPIIIHEEILRCHSILFSQCCEKAKAMRDKYAECRALLQALGAYLFPEVTVQRFEKERLELKAIPLLMELSTNYPLKSYQRLIKETVDEAVDEEVHNKNVKPVSFATGPGGVRKKESRDMTRAASLDARLGFLKSRGVREVAEQLYAKLHQIEKQERFKAQTNSLTALAQNRLLLPDTDDVTVQLLVQWIYRGTLDGHDANQTYALMNLAKRLGVEVLSELCLGILVNRLKDTLQAARVAGFPFAHLLGYGSGPANQLLDIVFNKVFLENDPPKRLKELVINAIADDLNMELWNHLKSTLSHELALQLIEAMILRGRIKDEQPGEVPMNLEECDVTGE